MNIAYRIKAIPFSLLLLRINVHLRSYYSTKFIGEIGQAHREGETERTE